MSGASGFLMFAEAFPTERGCIEYFEKLRWKDGVVSPFDKASKFNLINFLYNLNNLIFKI